MKTQSVQFGNVEIGGNRFVVMAGPCSIEGEQQFQSTAQWIEKNGARVLRGGVYKLRTSPKSFQGLGREALSLVEKIKKTTALPFISEVTDPRQISEMLPFVDVFQVGSRNMHNYELLKELGKTQRPVLLKRSFSGFLKEWLLAADYITDQGNNNVVLCERGIRTFETATRNTFDINAIAYIKQNSSFPIVADPSHGTGISSLVAPISLAAAAAGADGLILEVHPEPSSAKSDGQQALDFNAFSQLMSQLKELLPAVGKSL